MQLQAGTTLILVLIALVIGIFSFILGVVAVMRIGDVRKKMTTLFSGKEVSDLESVILSHSQEIRELDKEIQELFEISNKIHKLAANSIHKVDVLRFNPFKDIGGDQSFAIALLNGKDSGLVISSLHTREGTRIYAKPISKGVSEKYTLTEEEQLAIKNAVSVKPSKL